MKQTYSIGEVSSILNLPVSTLRYYDKEGLLNNVERTQGGIRLFKDEDIAHLNMLECLKKTGMSLKDIKLFFDWCAEGDSTIGNRYQMFLNQKAEIESQIQELQHTLDVINYKCEYYKTAMEEGTLETPKLSQLREETSRESDYMRKFLGTN